MMALMTWASTKGAKWLLAVVIILTLIAPMTAANADEKAATKPSSAAKAVIAEVKPSMPPVNAAAVILAILAAGSVAR